MIKGFGKAINIHKASIIINIAIVSITVDNISFDSSIKHIKIVIFSEENSLQFIKEFTITA